MFETHNYNDDNYNDDDDNDGDDDDNIIIYISAKSRETESIACLITMNGVCAIENSEHNLLAL